VHAPRRWPWNRPCWGDPHHWAPPSPTAGVDASWRSIQAANVTLFPFGDRVEGEIRVALDWRGALAGGAAFGVVTALLLFLLNMLGRSRRA
jgi:hypothetical protein